MVLQKLQCNSLHHRVDADKAHAWVLPDNPAAEAMTGPLALPVLVAVVAPLQAVGGNHFGSSIN